MDYVAQGLEIDPLGSEDLYIYDTAYPEEVASLFGLCIDTWLYTDFTPMGEITLGSSAPYFHEGFAAFIQSTVNSIMSATQGLLHMDEVQFHYKKNPAFPATNAIHINLQDNKITDDMRRTYLTLPHVITSLYAQFDMTMILRGFNGVYYERVLPLGGDISIRHHEPVLLNRPVITTVSQWDLHIASRYNSLFVPDNETILQNARREWERYHAREDRSAALPNSLSDIVTLASPSGRETDNSVLAAYNQQRLNDVIRKLEEAFGETFHQGKRSFG